MGLGDGTQDVQSVWQTPLPNDTFLPALNILFTCNFVGTHARELMYLCAYLGGGEAEIDAS